MAFLGLLVQNRDPIWGVTTLNSPCWYSCLLACPFRPVQVGMFVAPSLIFSSIPPTSVCICVSTRSHNHFLIAKWGFPGSSARKECTCSAGDPGSIPESGRSPGEVIDYPLQYSWASLVAQTVKNLPTMRETWVRSLDWEDSRRRPQQPTPVFLPGKLGAWWATVHGVAKSWTQLTECSTETSNTKNVCDGLKCWPQLFIFPWSLE